MNISFVILHYTAIELTKKCVKYIKENCDTDSYHIIIVDNASPDNSYADLIKEYSEDSYVTIIHNEENLGFARGNNVGFRYAVNELKSDFIVLINNDAFLTEKNIYKKLKEEYELSGFALAGPKILDISGEGNSNPFDIHIMTIPFCKFMIRRKKFDVIFTSINAKGLLDFIRKVLGKLRILRFPERPRIGNVDEKNIKEKKLYRCSLHGSCMFFSPAYTARYDGMDERTFMFGEENILHLQLLRDGLLSCYMPNISIKHVGNGSTNKVIKKSRDRLLFDYKNSITGLNVCKEILENYYRKNGHELYEDIINNSSEKDSI